MAVAVFAESFVDLPRADRAGPKAVRLDGRPWPVADSAPTPAAPVPGNTPRMLVPPGEHLIEGRLDFAAPPDALAVDPRTGMVELLRDGAALPFDLSADGRLRLAERRDATREGAALTVTVFRLVRDGSPLTVTTAVTLDVSGMARRLALEKLLPPDSVPLRASSPLPLAFGPDGSLFVQAGPGRFQLEVTSRLPGRVTELPRRPAPSARRYGPSPRPRTCARWRSPAPPVDPRNTDLPEAWKAFPAYAVTQGTPFSLTQTHRGEPAPGPDTLALVRTLWLDFDGRGLTAQDRLTGETRRESFLAMASPAVLGRVALSGGMPPWCWCGPATTAKRPTRPWSRA
jgi:hypothetical protein